MHLRNRKKEDFNFLLPKKSTEAFKDSENPILDQLDLSLLQAFR